VGAMGFAEGYEFIMTIQKALFEGLFYYPRASTFRDGLTVFSAGETRFTLNLCICPQDLHENFLVYMVRTVIIHVILLIFSQKCGTGLNWRLLRRKQPKYLTFCTINGTILEDYSILTLNPNNDISNIGSALAEI
jgi:hypothetical protein